MHEVEVSYRVSPSRDDLLKNLSPTGIIEYAGIYNINSLDERGSEVAITATFREKEMKFEFSEIKNGYRYTVMDGSDFYQERYSSITVHNEENTRVYITAHYSLNSIWSFILDRLAKATIQRELEMTITNLVENTIEYESKTE